MTEATGQSILVNTNTQLTQGVPPGVPGVQSASKLFGSQTGSPYTLFTFPGIGRVWGASLSFTIAANSSYAGATNNVYALLKTGSGVVLEIIELVVTNANQIDSDHGDIPLNGLIIASGDTLVLDVNNGVGVTNAVMRASGFVLYSVP